MEPTLRAGQLVMARRPRDVKVGDVVIIRHDGLEKIKRVRSLRDSQIYVLGDQPAYSTDSRHFGWLAEDSVIGRVWWPKLSRRLLHDAAGTDPL